LAGQKQTPITQFDKYVKGEGEIDVVKEAKKYPEIEISVKLKT